MHPPQKVPNNQPNNPTHQRAHLGASAGTVTAAPFEKWFPVVTTSVNLTPFVSALHRLEQTPLRGEIFEAHAYLKDGIIKISEDGERLALEKFESLTPSAQKRIVQALFSKQTKPHLRAPIPNYLDCIATDEFREDVARNVWVDVGRSLLREGVLPPSQVKESLKLTELTLTLNASSPTEYENKLLIGSGMIALYYFAPIQITALIAGLFGGVSILNYRDVRIGREGIRGYILESLDTYETIRTGNVRDLGQTLNEHFGDPQREDHYQKLWKASGFALARMLRVFGRSPDEIFSLFLDSPCINLRYNPAVQRTREHLEEHDAPCPQNILAPFMEEAGEGEPLAQTEALINQLNEIYFTLAICEREKLRCDLTKKTFESAAG
jgi:hypothetical protein